MPSPIAHAAAGYAIYKLLTRRKVGGNLWRIGPLPIILIIAIALSFLPDFDFAPGILIGDYDAFHNSYSNSIIVGLLLALLVGLVARISRRPQPFFWLLITFLAYELHVLMDYFGAGRGAMLFWPITDERYVSPVKLFYGLHRSDGLWSIRHLWTVLTEAIFAVALIVLANLLERSNISSFIARALGKSAPLDKESAT